MSDNILSQLADMVLEICQEQSLQHLQNYWIPKVAFRNQPYDDSSGSSLNSYMSACTSCYLDDSALKTSGSTDSYAYTSGPAPQAWSSPVPVPTIVEMAPLANTSGLTTQSTLDQVNAEIAQLNRELQELRNQMSQIVWTQQLQAQAAASPPPVDYGAIVTLVIETLVSKQLIQMTRR
ncbi:hypothetical protein ACA910_022236 [Epithemia clementina (nom. ined.)]